MAKRYEQVIAHRPPLGVIGGDQQGCRQGWERLRPSRSIRFSPPLHRRQQRLGASSAKLSSST